MRDWLCSELDKPTKDIESGMLVVKISEYLFKKNIYYKDCISGYQSVTPIMTKQMSMIKQTPDKNLKSKLTSRAVIKMLKDKNSGTFINLKIFYNACFTYN